MLQPTFFCHLDSNGCVNRDGRIFIKTSDSDRKNILPDCPNFLVAKMELDFDL